MFHNVLARQGFSIRNRARLYFQAFALSNMKMAAQESSRVGQTPGGVLDISLGGEVRHGPSYPDPV